jgi:energy-coupling factor transporter ATP-binding protein EcfA2
VHRTATSGVRRSGTSSPARLEIAGWGWRHAGRRAWAVRGVDLRVEPGERVLLLGPSGAGKSTLLAGVAGLLDPVSAAEQEGSITVDGRPARGAGERVGMLFQDPETSLVMARAGDDVAFGLENRGVPADEIWPRVDAALESVGFPYGRERSTDALSGGEQQRLALAGALVGRPGLLVLDEPTANLDPAGAAAVRETVRRVLDDSGATLLLVEHRVEEALDLVDRVVVLAPGGGLIADGPPEAVFRESGDALAAQGVWVPGAHDRLGGLRRTTSAGAGGPVLTGRGLSLTHPGAGRATLEAVDAELRCGQAVALTGRNGAGKTTLAMVLAGLVRPDRGDVRMTGTDRPLHRWRARDLVRRVGTVFQDPEHQFVTNRVEDELALGPRRVGAPDADIAARVGELLERLRLSHLAVANPYTLSGGEKRRLSVATALATAPDVLVLDEPTFGQDARTWHELLELCRELRDEGRALLTVTHDEAFVHALADRRMVLS